jgi:outer membrane protein assembly factor BamD (BamD/ComL family)
MTSILVAALLAIGSPAAARTPIIDAVAVAGDAQSSEQALYDRGTAALDRGEFDAAARAFADAAALKGERADGALYWRAYALNKRGRRDEALETIAALRSGHPKSRWIRDARALEVEIRQASGQAGVPESNGDDDLKLMALGGLMNADPDRALPLVEQMLAGSQSGKVRDRALFVLAQSGSPKAREVLVRIARTGPDEDTQTRAIRYLGLFGGPDSRQALVDIYKTSQNPRARKAVLQGFMVAGDRARLLEVARTETSPELKREAIHQIGVSGGRDELWQLYQQETSAELKGTIIDALFVGGAADRLAELAQKETDPRLRREAIQKLGLTGEKKSAALLKQMYAAEKDAAVKRTILEAFFIQGNATTLIEIARAEKDPALKRAAVEKLALMRSKEAADFMMELLK